MRVNLKEHPDSFHGSIRPLLIFAQICGLLPVKGIHGSNMRFTWRNPFHLYALIIFSVTLFFDVCYTIDNFNTVFGIDVFASTVFYTICLLTTYFFFEIARRLGTLAKCFVEVEKNMTDYGYPRYLGMKIKLLLYPLIMLAIIEHGALGLININLAWKRSTATGDSFGHSYYIIHFPAITQRLSYSGIGTIMLLWVNAMCTFNWNYLDFFLICISMQLSSRFHLINSRLKSVNLLKQDEAFWYKISMDYNSLSILTKKVDKLLSKVTLTSFFSNLYHLSLQLVRSLKVNGSFFQMAYFYFSLTYLISRLLLVLFFAARVHEESKKPAEVLFALQNPGTGEVRFLNQVLTDDIAITGNKFFFITRKFAVSVVGTVVTYQLVLLQFNSLQMP